jgi:DNA-directed RNA polymerase specialized sigma24 family protein
MEDEGPGDEAILAALGGAPDAFAIFFRRHADELLASLERETGDRALAADVCAEAFAVVLDGAHRFDPEQGTAGGRLRDAARRLLAEAGRDGVVEQRARDRLGIARLDHHDRAAFVAALEDELVAAARFRAAHPARRVALPRRAVLVGGAVALAALAAALALARGGDPPPPRPAAAPDATVLLAPMQPLTECRRPAGESLEPFGGFALLARPRNGDDLLGFAPRLLPIGSFDRRAPRRAANGVILVPSSHVAANGGCGFDDGSGVCLVAGRREFRCFTLADVRGGRAIARTGDGTVVGMVPDGVERVTVDGDGPPVSAEVRENVYEAPLRDLPGTRVGVTLARA